MARGNEKKKSKKKPLIVVDLDDDEEKTFPIEEEEAVYEVERVVDCRVHQPSGLVQFLLKWKGYPDDQNTWEYEYSLQCPNLVEEFMKRRQQEELCLQNPPQSENKPILIRSQKENQSKSSIDTKKTKVTNKLEVKEEQVVKPRMIDAALRICQEMDQQAKLEAPKLVNSQEKRGRESDKIKKQENEKTRSISRHERDEQPMLEDDDSVINEFIPKSVGRVHEISKSVTNSAGNPKKKTSLQEKKVAPYKVPASSEKKKGKSQEFEKKKSSPPFLPEIKDCNVRIDVRGFSRGLEPDEIVGITELPNKKGNFFLMRWKGDSTHDLIPDSEANRVCPQLVIAFYQARLHFKNGIADLTF